MPVEGLSSTTTKLGEAEPGFIQRLQDCYPDAKSCSYSLMEAVPAKSRRMHEEEAWLQGRDWDKNPGLALGAEWSSSTLARSFENETSDSCFALNGTKTGTNNLAKA